MYTMRLLRQIILMSVCAVLPVHSFGQFVLPIQSFRLNDNHNINKQDVYTLRAMGMTYTPPEGFYGTYGQFKNKSAPSFGRIGSIIQSSIESKDNTFAVLFYILPRFDKEDPFNALTIKIFKVDINCMHLHLLNITPGVKSVRYHPHEYAREKFNADTAIVFDMEMHGDILSEDHLFGKYRKCKGVLLQKKNRGYIAMFCFYNKDRYWRENIETVEKLFKYN